MGRDVRRVPLDFEWPLNKVWKGYSTPPELIGESCPDCGGHGWTAGYEWVRAGMQLILMAAEDAKITQNRADHNHLHPYLDVLKNRPYREVHTPWTPEEVAHAKRVQEQHEKLTGKAIRDYETRLAAENRPRVTGYTYPRPTADIVPFVEALTGSELHWIGSTSTDTYRAINKICEAIGIDDDAFGRCERCGGHGDLSTDEQRAAAEAWQWDEPPTGEGWQLWETVSEGSPISPVFAHSDGLIDWLCTDYSWGAQREPLTRAQAEAFVGVGHSVGSFVITGSGKLVDGIAAVHELRGKIES